uniref:SP-RING-type domain-containing protein n=1 Tax=Syphacia muris TaxID=451379 RepID=A0A0N5AIL1_9BILA
MNTPSNDDSMSAKENQPNNAATKPKVKKKVRQPRQTTTTRTTKRNWDARSSQDNDSDVELLEWEGSVPVTREDMPPITAKYRVPMQRSPQFYPAYPEEVHLAALANPNIQAAPFSSELSPQPNFVRRPLCHCYNPQLQQHVHSVTFPQFHSRRQPISAYPSYRQPLKIARPISQLHQVNHHNCIGSYCENTNSFSRDGVNFVNQVNENCNCQQAINIMQMERPYAAASSSKPTPSPNAIYTLPPYSRVASGPKLQAGPRKWQTLGSIPHSNMLCAVPSSSAVAPGPRLQTATTIRRMQSPNTRSKPISVIKPMLRVTPQTTTGARPDPNSISPNMPPASQVANEPRLQTEASSQSSPDSTPPSNMVYGTSPSAAGPGPRMQHVARAQSSPNSTPPSNMVYGTSPSGARPGPRIQHVARAHSSPNSTPPSNMVYGTSPSAAGPGPRMQHVARAQSSPNSTPPSNMDYGTPPSGAGPGPRMQHVARARSSPNSTPPSNMVYGTSPSGARPGPRMQHVARAHSNPNSTPSSNMDYGTPPSGAGPGPRMQHVARARSSPNSTPPSNMVYGTSPSAAGPGPRMQHVARAQSSPNSTPPSNMDYGTPPSGAGPGPRMQHQVAEVQSSPNLVPKLQAVAETPSSPKFTITPKMLSILSLSPKSRAECGSGLQSATRKQSSPKSTITPKMMSILSLSPNSRAECGSGLQHTSSANLVPEVQSSSNQESASDVFASPTSKELQESEASSILSILRSNEQPPEFANATRNLELWKSKYYLHFKNRANRPQNGALGLTSSGEECDGHSSNCLLTPSSASPTSTSSSPRQRLHLTHTPDALSSIPLTQDARHCSTPTASKKINRISDRMSI